MRYPNHSLAEHLKRAGWRPPQLVDAVNSLLGEGYLSRSTVSEWLHAGRVPREPLPAIIAALLGRATGQPVSVKDLWPGAAVAPAWSVPADHGLDVFAAAPNPALAVAHDWSRHADRRAGRDLRHFTPVPDTVPHLSGSAALPVLPDSATALGATVHAVAQQLAQLPATREGLCFAHRHIAILADTAAEAPGDGGVALGLASATSTAAELAHTIGRYGIAQRYRTTSHIIVSALNAMHMKRE